MAGQAGRLIAASALLAVTGMAGDTPVASLAGRYSAHFTNALVTGEEYGSDNVVEIVPVDATHAYVRFALEFYNGHSCSLAGIAAADGASLVYREPPPGIGADGACTLTIRREGDKLAWSDHDGSCKAYCGARGSFLHDDLPWSSKRPIRYLAKLKRSSEYRNALTEWRTGHAVLP